MSSRPVAAPPAGRSVVRVASGARGWLGTRTPDQLISVAVIASLVMVAVSWSAGGIPYGWTPVLLVPAQLVYYAGLIAYSVVWLEFGRRLFTPGAEIESRVLRRLTLRSATPFLLAAPFGRDLAAYAAQGNVIGRGLDPYRHGPASAPGAFTGQVSHRWLHSPAPYGPEWLRISQFAAWLSHGHPLIAELLLRLPAYVGLLLCVWALPKLAQRLDGRTARGLWLGVASPLVLVFGVGGGHNDLLMMGVAVAGLAVACGPTWWHLAGGAAIAGIAIMIKSPAVVVVAFAVPVWLAANRKPGDKPVSLGRIAIACATAVSASGVAVGVCQIAGGLGWGWARQVDSDPGFNSPFALPSAIVLLIRTVSGLGAPSAHDEVLHEVRTVGEVIAAAVVLALWMLAVQRARRHRDTSGLGRLTGALVVLAVLAPLVQPWYYIWALLFAGFVIVRPRSRVLTAAIAIWLTAMILPSGLGWLGSWGALIVAPIALALSVAMLNRPQRRPSAG